MQHVQLRLGFPQEELDRIFNGSDVPEPAPTSAPSPSFHSSYVAETSNRHGSSDVPLTPAVYKERGTLMGHRIDPTIPCWPGSGFVPLALPVRKKSTRPKRPSSDTVSPQTPAITDLPSVKTSARKPRVSVPRISIPTPKRHLPPPPSVEVQMANPHTQRTPRSSQLRDDVASFHIHTTVKVHHEVPVAVIIDADDPAHNHERLVEQKRWTEAVQWLKQQRESLQHDDKVDAEAKRQRILEMDRQIRLQNQRRFAKSPRSAPSKPPPPSRPTQVQLELPPRKPPVPRLASTKKKRRHAAIDAAPPKSNNDDNDVPRPAPPRPVARRKRKPAPEPQQPAADTDKVSEDTRKRRELARVYMEQQKTKRKERARQRCLQEEHEATARREQLQKLDQVRWQRVQESVALASKNGGHRRASNNLDEADAATASITELLLGFHQATADSNPTAKKGAPRHASHAKEEASDDDAFPTDSAPEPSQDDKDEGWSSADDTEGLAMDDHVPDAPEDSAPPPPPASSLLAKLQALKNLTDQLTSRVGQLSNNVDESEEASDDESEDVEASDTEGDAVEAQRSDWDDAELSSHEASDESESPRQRRRRPERVAALETASSPSMQMPDMHLDGPPEPAPRQPMDIRQTRWEDESLDASATFLSRTEAPLVHVSSPPRQLQNQLKEDDETRAPTNTTPPRQAMEHDAEPLRATVDYNSSSSTDDEKEVARWMALRQRRQQLAREAKEEEDRTARTRVRESNASDDEDRSDARPKHSYPSTVDATMGASSSWHRPAYHRSAAEDNDAELDRLIHATRDAYSVVDMYAHQLFQEQQQRRLLASTADAHVSAPASRFEIVASDGDEREDKDDHDDGDEDDLTASIRWSSDGPHRQTVDEDERRQETFEGDSGIARQVLSGRSIDELLAEANRVLRRSNSVDDGERPSAFWDRAIRDDDDDDAVAGQMGSSSTHGRQRSHVYTPRIVVDDDDDANLRYSPRTLARQLMAAVEFQESLHEAQMDLSALEYAHEMERHQDEMVTWGQSIQEDVESMAHAQALLDQHVQMQEELHQQELVMQALAQAAQDRDKLVEQGCQTDELARHHAATMAQWTVETGTMAVEARDGFVQCTLQNSVAIQSDEADVHEWEARLAGPPSPAAMQVAAPLDARRPAQFQLDIDKKTHESATQSADAYSETFKTSSPKRAAPPPLSSPKRVAVSVDSMEEDDDDAGYSQGFDSPTKEVSRSDAIPEEEEDDDGAKAPSSNVSVESEDNLSDGFESPGKASVVDDPDDDQVAASADAPRPPDDAVESEDYSEGFDSPPKPTATAHALGDIPDEEDGSVAETEDDARATSDVPSDDDVSEIEESAAAPSPVKASIASDMDDDAADAYSVDNDMAASIPHDQASVKDEENYSEGFESPRSKPSASPRHRDDVQAHHSAVEAAKPRQPPAASPWAPPSVPGADIAPLERVEAYLAHLRVRDPEKEEYIRSILARKASEDKILAMRQRSLATRRNVSRMQFQAERMQLDSCRAANVARCYEDMMLFRQDEVEDPDEIDVLAMAFGHVAVGLDAGALRDNNQASHAAAEAPVPRQAPVREPQPDAESDDEDEDDLKKSSGHADSVPGDDDYDEDAFEEKSAKGVSEVDEIQDEVSSDASAASEVVDVEEVPQDKLESLRQSDANEYSMDDFASTKDNDEKSIADVVDDAAVVPDVAIPEDEDDGFDEYSMDDFSAKQSIADGSNDVEEDGAATVGAAASVDAARVSKDQPHDGEIDDDEPGDVSAIIEDKGDGIVDEAVVEDDDEEDKHGYSNDDFNSTSVVLADKTPLLVEAEDEAQSVDDEDAIEEGRANTDKNDLIEDEAEEEEAGHDDDYSMDEFASGATLPTVASPSPDPVDEYGSDEFDKSDHGDASPSLEHDLAEKSAEHDVSVAEKASNTSQELQMALDKIATDFPAEIGRDEAKWHRRKAQALALVEAKERAIAQLKHQEEVKQINDLVAYSLKLNVEEEAKRSAATAPLVPPTASIPAVVEQAARQVAAPAVEKAESVDEYSDSFENKSDDVAYTDDAFEDEATEVVAGPELAKAVASPATDAEPSLQPSEVDPSTTPVELESSLSRSIDAHEHRLTELKESLATKQDEAVQLTALVIKEERRVALEAEEKEMLVQLDQTERLVATNQSRLSDLQRHRKEPAPVAPAMLPDDGDLPDDEASFEVAEGGVQIPSAPNALCEMHDPDGSSDAFSADESQEGDVAKAEQIVAASAVDGAVVGHSIGASLEISIVDGDSMSDDDDDQSFASCEDVALMDPPVASPLDEAVQPCVASAFDVATPEPLKVASAPEVLDDSFTSVDDTSPQTQQQDLLAGFDLVETAAPSNWMHEMATQTIGDPVAPHSLDQFDYIEDAESVHNHPEGTALSSDQARRVEDDVDLLALYDVVETVEGPTELADDTFLTKWETEYQSLLAGYDHIEGALPPALSTLTAIQQDDVVTPHRSDDTADLLGGYDVVEVVEVVVQWQKTDEAPVDGSLAFAEPIPPTECAFERNELGLDELAPDDDLNPLEEAKEVVVTGPLEGQQLVSSPFQTPLQDTPSSWSQPPPAPAADLLESFDYDEAAIAPTTLLPASIDLLSSFDFNEAALPPRTTSPPTSTDSQESASVHATASNGEVGASRVPVDNVTDLIWNDMLGEVLSTTDFSPTSTTPTPISDDSITRSDTHDAALAPVAPPSTALDATEVAPPTTPGPSSTSVDGVTDILMDELVQETLAFCLRRDSTSSSVPPKHAPQPSQHRQIATAPADAHLRNVTHFPDHYTTLMESRQPFDWTSVDEDVLRSIEDDSDNVRSPTPLSAGNRAVHGSAIQARRRLLKEWTAIQPARGRPVPPTAKLDSAPLSMKELYLATQDTSAKSVSTLVQSLVKEAVREVTDTNDEIVDSLVTLLLDDTVAEVLSTAARTQAND